MVSPLSAATQGFISDGSHIPLVVSVQGLLIFAFVPVSGGSRAGGSQSVDEDIEGGSHQRRKAHYEAILREDEELLEVIKTWLQQR